jgi:methyl-accepting chemotaxis protein/putative methionine-R-sulfoxide reductase with GAF domain
MKKRKHKIRTQVLTCFLLISLIPIFVFIYFTYTNMEKEINDDILYDLTTAAKLKSTVLSEYIKEKEEFLEFQAIQSSTAVLLEKLHDSYNESGKALSDFIKSYKWVSIVNAYNNDYVEMVRITGLYDVFLVDTNGNILYTAKRENDLGTNIFTGKYNNTSLSRIVATTIKSGKGQLSAIENYKPSGNTAAVFVSHIILNEDGDDLGVIAMQLSTSVINNIFADASELKSSLKTYLLDHSGTVMTNFFDEKGSLINKVFAGKPLEIWKNADEKMLEEHREHTLGDTSFNDEIINRTGLIKYKGFGGQNVIGIIHEIIPLTKYGQHLAVLAEINETEAYSQLKDFQGAFIILIIITLLVVIIFSLILTRLFVKPILKIKNATFELGKGNYSTRTAIKAKNEFGELSDSFNEMAVLLEKQDNDNSDRNWTNEGLQKINELLRVEKDLMKLGDQVCSFIADYIGIHIATFYLLNDEQLHLSGSYAFCKRKSISNIINIGEGFIGQAAKEKKVISVTNIPQEYTRINSSTGELKPFNIVVIPFIYNFQMFGAIELGTFEELEDYKLEFLKLLSEPIGISINNVNAENELQKLLHESEDKSMELQAQQEELKQANEELEGKTKELQQSEEELKQGFVE